MGMEHRPGSGSRRTSRTHLRPCSALTDLVVITGFSGAGKSTAMAAFEDEGYFCVDNLPSEMIRSLVDLFMHAGSKVQRAAVVSDVRGGSYFEGLAQMLDDLRAPGVTPPRAVPRGRRADAADPLQGDAPPPPAGAGGSVADGIARERELLAPLRDRADVVINTTGLTAAMLRRKLADELLPTPHPGPSGGHVRELRLQVRPGARPRPAVRRPVPAQPALRAGPAAAHRRRSAGGRVHQPRRRARPFYERLHPLLDYLLPQYLAEGKAHLVVAVGCTGGRHRSVAIAEHLADRYRPRQELPGRGRPPRREQPGVIDHVGFEVSDLRAVGALLRRGLLRARRRGGCSSPSTPSPTGSTAPLVWIVVRGRPPAPGYGHVALQRQRQGGGRRAPTGPGWPTAAATTARPGTRPQYGRRYYAAYLLDPDGLRGRGGLARR